MFHANTLSFVEWWRSLPQGRWAPVRADVDPAQLASSLPQVFILNERFVFRLAGGEVCALLGGEQRGLSWTAPFAIDQQTAAVALCRQALVGEPVIADLTGASARGEAGRLQVAMAPLTSAPNGRADRLIGHVHVFGRPEAPLRTLRVQQAYPSAPANESRPRLITLSGRRVG